MRVSQIWAPLPSHNNLFGVGGRMSRHKKQDKAPIIIVMCMDKEITLWQSQIDMITKINFYQSFTLGDSNIIKSYWWKGKVTGWRMTLLCRVFTSILLRKVILTSRKHFILLHCKLNLCTVKFHGWFIKTN